MTYDPVDTNDDGVVDADVNNQSVNTNKGTLDGDTMVGYPSATTIGFPGFDSWTEVDPDRPALIVVRVSTETDGNTRGLTEIQVDESGGTSPDYKVGTAFADADAGSNVVADETAMVPIVAGAQFQIANIDDPNGANGILFVRYVIF